MPWITAVATRLLARCKENTEKQANKHRRVEDDGDNLELGETEIGHLTEDIGNATIVCVVVYAG